MGVARSHGKDRGVTAPGGPALRPEDRTEGRLSDRHDRLRADAVQGLAEANRRQGLPFAVAGRRRAGDEDELPLAGLPRAVHGGEADLRDVVALEDEVVPAEA